MAAAEILALPEDFTSGCIQAGSAEAAEVDIYPPRLEHRRRCCVAIHRGAVAERFRIITVKHLFVEANLAGFGVETDGKKVMAIQRRGSQPDLAAHHYRRGPTTMRHLRFPFDVIGF